jgi:LmbE family N-acetylglucosaminyl deacetylase
VDASDIGSAVLVVAPHPDDEVLAAGGTMSALVRAGARVRVVLLTAGDGYLRAARRIGSFSPDDRTYRRLGELRLQESVEAAAHLGLQPDAMSCLGYPDGRLADLAEGCWEPASAVSGRAGATSVPYEWAITPGAPCCGSGLVADLASVLATFRPDTVIVPARRDNNADHAAAAQLAQRALSGYGFAGRRLAYLVHAGHYPYPWAYRPSASLNPPRALRNEDWISVPLEERDLDAKTAALRAFATQNAIPDLRYFMRAFLRANELFVEAPDDRAT